MGVILQEVVALRLVGGLGSQLHKYCFGYALARELDVTLALDLDWYKRRGQEEAGRKRRDYLLDQFLISATTSVPPLTKNVASLQAKSFRYAKRLFGPQGSAESRKRLGKLFSKLGIVHFDFRDGETWQDVRSTLAKPVRYVSGEFGVDFSTFQHLRKDLQDELSPVIPLSPLAREILRKIDRTNSIAVHVRRGDYLHGTYFSVQKPEYFSVAIDELIGSLISPRVYLFSDDISWCEEILQPRLGVNSTIVGNLTTYEDFQLLSKARSLVISNSGFSSMAAWLSSCDPRVVAPKQWFSNQPINEIQLASLPLEWSLR